MRGRGQRFTRGTAFALLASTLVSAACSSDEFPSNAVPFAPPAHFALYWEQVQACSGQWGDLSRLRWYTTPPLEPIQGVENASGLYNPSGHRIVLDFRYKDEGDVVRHEMLHALYPRARHPREIFLHRCGDVVPCNVDCAAEGGEPPVRGPEVRRITPAEIKVQVQVRPSVPSLAVFEGRFIIVVIAQNPYDEPVVVNFPDSNYVFGGARAFGYRLEEAPSGAARTYQGHIYDRGAGYFRAGESKRAVYDFRIDPANSNFPRVGPHFVVGMYSTTKSDTLRFNLVPSP